MKLLLKPILSLLVLLASSTPLSAMDVIDLYHGLQTWSMRWGGYRNYRVPVTLASGKTCVLAITAHVNPSVDQHTLLIHGFGDSRFMWWKWIETYAKHPLYSSFIAIDLPLHGNSDCDAAEDWDTIVAVLERGVKNFGRGPITRIIGQSLGVVPTALLAEKYPRAQQVWLTPPLLKDAPLTALVAELLEIDTPVEVQVFMNRVLTKDREFPDFVRKEILERIAKSQKILRKTSVKGLRSRVLERSYPDLLIITGAKDELVPPDELDPAVAKLSSREIFSVVCGHDILRHCGEDVKALVEQSRFPFHKATY